MARMDASTQWGSQSFEDFGKSTTKLTSKLTSGALGSSYDHDGAVEPEVVLNMDKRTTLDGVQKEAATLTFRNLKYSVKGKGKQKKVIIDGVSGYVIHPMCAWTNPRMKYST